MAQKIIGREQEIKEIEAFFLSFYSLCQRQSYPTLDDMIVVGVKNKMLKSKCREIYEEVKSALGIVPSKAGKCDEAIKNIRNFVTK